MENSKEFKVSSDTRNPLNYKSICERDDTLPTGDGPFGMAYDIDNLPKIMMVHTLDRATDECEEKSTFIDIYSKESLRPCFKEHLEESNHIAEWNITSESELDDISCSNGGLLHEAICNAKKFARNNAEVQTMEKASWPTNNSSADDGLCCANERRKNLMPRRLYNMKTTPRKYAQPTTPEYERIWSYVNSNRRKSYFTSIENGKTNYFVMR